MWWRQASGLMHLKWEMGALMLDLDLKGHKLCGRASPSFGLIWLPASRDPETWPLRGSLIDGQLGANSTIWDVDQHNVEVGTSYGFSRHTKVVDIAASKVLFGLLKSGITWCKWAWQSLSRGLWKIASSGLRLKSCHWQNALVTDYLLFALCWIPGKQSSQRIGIIKPKLEALD
jgi:hypothetical protein